MNPFVVSDPTGRILRSGWAPDVAIQARNPGEIALEATGPILSDFEGPIFVGVSYYVASGEIAVRPATGLPAAHTVTANTDWLVPNVPVGTVVFIDGDDAGTVDTGDLVLSFALAGVWQVELRPPFPWVEAKCEVTVT